MKNTQSMAKRIMAMLLVLSMMLTTLGGYAPGWFRAFADEAGAEEQFEDASTPVEEETSEQEEAPAESQEEAAPAAVDEAPAAAEEADRDTRRKA